MVEKYNVEDFGEFNELKFLKQEFEGFPKQLNINKKLIFQVNFVKDFDFNANASIKNEMLVSNINIACILEMYHHALMVMTKNNFFDNLGLEENIPQTFVLEDFENPKIIDDGKFKYLHFYAGPTNNARIFFGKLIGWIGTEFIMFHEFSHLIGGHIKYINKNLNISKLYVQNNNDFEDIVLFQTLEMDADAMAIEFLLNNMIGRMKYLKELLNENYFYIPNLIITAITIMFFLLDKKVNDNKNLDSIYLPRDYRYNLVLTLFLSKLTTTYHELKFNLSNEDLLSIAMECNNILKNLYSNYCPNKELLFLEDNYINDYYYNVILKKWAKIREPLQKVAYMRLAE